MELVTGATGYVGSRLVRRLVAEGRAVRALARRPEKLEPLDGVEAVAGDLVTGAGLDRALEGWRRPTTSSTRWRRPPPSGNGFADRDRAAAEAFATAATKAGVERIVYLGGIEPADAPLSAHLGSRLEVERILLEAAAGRRRSGRP